MILKTLILPKKIQNTRYHISYPRVSHIEQSFLKSKKTRIVFIFTLVMLFIVPVLKAQAAFFDFLFTGVRAEGPSKNTQNTQTMVLPSPDQEIISEKNVIVDNQIHKIESINSGLLEPEIGPIATDSKQPEQYENDTVSVYTVHRGDTIKRVAQLFDVSENTVRWANNLKKGEALTEGRVLVILPISGISHTVKKGDTLKSIARKYNANVEDIGMFNGLELDSELAYGETIIIPDGEIKEAEPISKKQTSVTKLVKGATKLIKGFSGNDLGGYFIRPILGGIRTQGLHGKNAVDVAAPIGTPVYAAAGGSAIVATEVGYNGGYGKYIILSHPNGTQTIYGHLSRVLITPGQTVQKGEQIGLVGSTGRSTGPHLHFEVRGAKNPLGDNPRYGL